MMNGVFGRVSGVRPLLEPDIRFTGIRVSQDSFRP